ncbi:hypothetical protein PAXINDRAFT_173094 [Paxillus involutus ATCC 200175]|uniref:F-box domain-containing protein n=1 Tax=Paxillus involutus ATCC 200175 TaxID=664439 RepID=A0A0C9TJP7_PAXIN|nr:hypothetical protein PAXINDRAFT_173094 [Paxillus involutus ATCC 200175]
MPKISYSRPLPFPVELIFKVLSFVNARDIVRLRTVSKQFYDIAHDPQLWRALYVTSCVPRPPGPFLWQSTECLERTLVQSEQLSRKWTSEPLKFAARALPDLYPTQWALLFGRWFIWTDDTTNLRSHNLDTGVEQVLWQVEESSRFVACPTTSVDGRMINIILYDVGEVGSPPTVTNLLEYQVHEDSCSLSDAVSHGIPGLQGRLRTNGQVPYGFYFDEGNHMLDSKTGSFYKLPPFNSIWRPKVILTKTHLIALCIMSHTATLVRAFIIPHPPSPTPPHATVNELCLTHEAHMDECPSPVLLIRDSVFDTITRSTNLRFLVGFDDHQTNYCCLDLTLPEPSSGEVMPMSIRIQDLFAVDCDSEPALAGGSADGHVRGFVSRLTGDDSCPHGDVINIQKFTIDASQEKCTAVLGEPAPVAFPQNLGGISAMISRFNFTSNMSQEFDAIRGRFCYDIDNGSRLTDIVFFDLE